MIICPLAKSGVDLASVHLDHFAAQIKDGDDHRTVQVLVAAGPDNAYLLEPPTLTPDAVGGEILTLPDTAE